MTNRTVNPDKLRRALLLNLDFEQDDPRIVREVKQVIRNTPDAELVAHFEAAFEESFAETIREAYRASGATDESIARIVKLMAWNDVL